MSDVKPATDEQCEEFFDLLQSFGCESRGEVDSADHEIRCSVCYGPWGSIIAEISHSPDCAVIVGPNVKARFDSDRATIAAQAERIKQLEEALRGLVECNEDWNAAVAETIGRTPGWTDAYLNVARAALAKAKEKA